MIALVSRVSFASAGSGHDLFFIVRGEAGS